VKEVQLKTIFRYAHVFPAVLSLMSKGTIDVKPLITNKFDFKDAVEAFEFSAKHAKDCYSDCVKNMLILD
jgi:D-xylulose reductase